MFNAAPILKACCGRVITLMNLTSRNIQTKLGYLNHNMTDAVCQRKKNI